MGIPFIDLGAQQAGIRSRIDAAIAEVLDSGAYVMGPKVAAFEKELAAFCGAKHALACANGTDALMLGLMAFGIRAGDAVFVPSFTFAATAEVVPCMGAVPFFVDILPGTFNMDPQSLKRCIVAARDMGLNPRMVVPVDLFGLPADMAAIQPVADEAGLVVMCDSAQGFGGRIGNRMTGTFGKLTTTSFFPAKPLGCYGDGGAIFTDDDEIAALVDSYRIHGKGTDKYDNVRIGMNSRLDSIQAAILSVKLSIYAEEIEARNRIAARYNALLNDKVIVPQVAEGFESVWAQYTIRMPDARTRGEVQAHLFANGIPTAIYYPIPLHRQTAYDAFPSDPAGMKATDLAADEVLSLPMHAYLDEKTQDRIVNTLAEALA
ncbi:MAG: DegT/DnrJ/EryC1/StrS aminotransferase family protein [Zhengella sp.]|uniref:DegT/DnrJ/EryC1/StrS family aminotransferase n=1 Tax=Zhengella sp. TaxID=2282762 RepID=UPI001DDDA5E1|nr:DegT/DnrJ/EryC1/StrS aminotransferase family protein [Notoacmeibacter sp.]MCC0026276.1 DegT/DnrJ/EryC1/StrS aminotransferase family protein [Brucellaceae bacterium]